MYLENTRMGYFTEGLLWLGIGGLVGSDMMKEKEAQRDAEDRAEEAYLKGIRTKGPAELPLTCRWCSTRWMVRRGALGKKVVCRDCGGRTRLRIERVKVTCPYCQVILTTSLDFLCFKIACPDCTRDFPVAQNLYTGDWAG
jgi:hypothetical protein